MTAAELSEQGFPGTVEVVGDRAGGGVEKGKRRGGGGDDAACCDQPSRRPQDLLPTRSGLAYAHALKLALLYAPRLAPPPYPLID